jgi:hypothetical protein
MKWTRLQLDFETHNLIQKIQIAEIDKFSYLEKRNMDEIMKDALKLGLREFIKTHDLNITL